MSNYLYDDYLKIVDQKTFSLENEMFENNVKDWVKHPMTKTFFNYIFCRSQEIKEEICFREDSKNNEKFIGAYQFAIELLEKLKEFK